MAGILGQFDPSGIGGGQGPLSSGPLSSGQFDPAGIGSGSFSDSSSFRQGQFDPRGIGTGKTPAPHTSGHVPVVMTVSNRPDLTPSFPDPECGVRWGQASDFT